MQNINIFSVFTFNAIWNVYKIHLEGKWTKLDNYYNQECDEC